MDVAVSSLRAHLGDWIDRAQAGEEIVVTERGAPVARLIGLNSTPSLERLAEQGVIARPDTERRAISAHAGRVPVKGSVADLVVEQRR
ncbi:MAG: type II toxin-antitoxin system prevent-host-death family antitoxin [Actinomycetota bacterium]|nr:type II toxin-antitoxin system prevent-host-death family antitoxin [Actinomycetota bacterium]